MRRLLLAGIWAGLGAGLLAQVFRNPNDPTLQTPAPVVAFVVPTSSSTYDAGTATTLAISGTATAPTGVTTCTWMNSVGGLGIATTAADGSWSVVNVPLGVGSNVLTVTCQNSQNIAGATTLTVTAAASGGNVIAGARLPSGGTSLPEPAYSTYGVRSIPPRTTICTTLSAGATVAQINTALSGCTSGQTVFLNAGTYTGLTGPINLRSNVTLRGAGADQTHLQFSNGGSCGPVSAWVCWPGANADGSSGMTFVNVNCASGCLAKGDTTATLSGAMPAVGAVGFFDQVVDGSTLASDRWPDVWICQTVGVCITEGNNGNIPQSGRGVNATARTQSQSVLITAVNGSVITFTPAIAMPNWRASQTPQFGIPNSGTVVHDSGIEDLSLERSAGGTGALASAFSANVWARGLRIVNDSTGRGSSFHHVYCYYSVGCTFRENYFFDGANITNQDSYVWSSRVSSSVLIENNITQRVRSAVLTEQGGQEVVAYNYSIHLAEGWQFSGAFDNHGGSGDFYLLEGNDDVFFQGETLKGFTSFATLYRNHFLGKESGGTSGATSPLMIFAFDRWTNAVGNVLGLTGYHTQYQFKWPGASGNCLTSIYAIGGADTGGTDGECAGAQADAHTGESMFRWGNWDVVTSTNDNGANDLTGIKWDSSEVPSGLALYAQPVPSNHTLPASLIYASVPSFFSTLSVPWPPIGPDVANGDITNAGGHAYRIPARKCFEDVMGGTYADTTAKTFNRVTCYGS